MEMEEIQNACKMSRIGNKIGLLGGSRINGNYDDQEDENNGGDAGKIESNNRLRAWHSSRIFRVSRASGGKDRHSKVLTAKGLRDRRVRLSVSTAIQFYDLQDRLGYDQPSKAVEWLINAAADAISELPSLESRFPDTPQQVNSDDEKRICVSKARFDTELLENDPAFQQQQQDQQQQQQQHQQQQQQHISMSKSACSSTSETSKGSVLSLSRTENRVKARERARERTKDKDKEQQIDDSPGGSGGGHQHNSQNASFTELLNSGGGGGGRSNNHHTSSSQSAPQNHSSPANFFFKQSRHSSPPSSMDCFHGGMFGGGQTPSSSRNNFSGYPAQPTHFGISPSTHTMTLPPSFTLTNEHPHHSELHQFSFLPDHLIPDAPQPVNVVSGNDYNLNFSISSGLAGYNRGTLQSNSPSPQQHLHRFSDGSNMPFYVGNPTNADVPAAFDARLQLYYGDGSRHSDTKGKDHKH